MNAKLSRIAAGLMFASALATSFDSAAGANDRTIYVNGARMNAIEIVALDYLNCGNTVPNGRYWVNWVNQAWGYKAARSRAGFRRTAHNRFKKAGERLKTVQAVLGKTGCMRTCAFKTAVAMSRSSTFRLINSRLNESEWRSSRLAANDTARWLDGAGQSSSSSRSLNLFFCTGRDAFWFLSGCAPPFFMSGFCATRLRGLPPILMVNLTRGDFTIPKFDRSRL